MKKVSFILASLLLTFNSYASIGTPQLSDSLTQFAKDQIWTGPVRVENIRVTGNKVVVKTNHTLSTLSWSPQMVDSVYKMVSRWTLGHENGKVSILTETNDKYDELSTLITSRHLDRKDIKEHYTRPMVTPLVSQPENPAETGSGLAGRHLAIYGSHGLYYMQAQERWTWQRAKILTTVEDLYTTSYTMPFLVPMLERAGAIVIQPRERDTQLDEVIVDDREATKIGDWATVVTGGWAHSQREGGVLIEGENPFTMGGYAYTSEERQGKKSVRYTPDLQVAGSHAVYVSYKTVEGSTEKADYTVCHKGVTTRFMVNQQMSGGTWVYLGTFDFSQNPDENFVEVRTSSSKGVLTTDAVKFGGGMGSIARYPQSEILENVPSAKENGKQEKKHSGVVTPDSIPAIATTSNFPRWIEGARYWYQYSGIPDSVYNYTESRNDYTDDYASRGRWVNWLAGGSSAYPDAPGLNIPIDLGLAFHTDAGTYMDDEIVGTLIIYTSWDNDLEKKYPNGISRAKARDFADYMQTQLVEDVRALYAPEWKRRQLQNSSYAESRNPKVPMVLLEFLSHQNYADMKYGLDPGFQFVVSRAIYKSMLRFIHEQYGSPYVVQPLPVSHFASQLLGTDSIALSWQPRIDQLEETATPTYYVLYTRKDGSDWDNGVRINGTSVHLAAEKGVRYDYKVAAGNAGGLSMDSEVLTAHQAKDSKGKVMIVNAFTRVSAPGHFEHDSLHAGFTPGDYAVYYMGGVNYIGEMYNFDRSKPWTSDDECGFGTSYANYAKIVPKGNTFDYPVMHGEVLQQMGYSFASSSVAAFEENGAAGYELLDVILGKQKETSIGTQMVRTDFKTFSPNFRKALEAYTGKLLLAGSYIGTDMKSKADQDWTKKALHYYYRVDHATQNGLINLQPSFGKAQYQLYQQPNETIIPAEAPDALVPSGDGAKVFARYDDSITIAGIAYKDQSLIFGFPLESLHEFKEFYQMCINHLMSK